VEKTYHPVGDTDSEAVFCAILNALQAEFSELPPLELLQESLRRLCDEISTEPHTIFNFLLACGQYTTFAYSWPGSRPGSKVWNGLWYLVREPPFSSAKLIDVVDYCATIEFAQVNTLSDRIAVITTKPLTNETGWKEFKRGELLMFDRGIPYSAPGNVSVVEREKKEKLCSKTFSLSSSPTGVEKLTNMLARTAI
jgi:glutamine amidotransferase